MKLLVCGKVPSRTLPLTQLLLVMKLTIILILFGTLGVSAGGYTQQVSLHVKNAPLEQVFLQIEKQTGYSFLFTYPVLQKAGKVNINVSEATLSQVLEACFKNQPLVYNIVDKAVIVKTKEEAARINTSQFWAAPMLQSVFGFVKDEKGNAIEGASVLLKPFNKGTSTGKDGSFLFPAVPAGNYNIEITYIGYQKITQNIRVAETPVSLNFSLLAVTDEMKGIAVVSTGYQTISKERAAGSFSSVTANDMSGKLQTNIIDRLEGMAAGLTMYKGEVQVRGVSTINGTSTPLYVVDGIPYEGSLAAINPADIGTVTILKDATAASIYGARAANGVIVIVTRGGKAGQVRVNYNGSLKLTPLPDRGYLNRMSSEELVNFQQDMFKLRSGDYNSIDPRKSMNDVYRVLYERKAGNITEEQLQTQLNVYRNNDRYDQVVDELLHKNALLQQHNLSVSGGSNIHTYYLAANYLQSNPYEREQNSKRLGYNLKNSFNFTKWMKADIGMLGSSVNQKYNNGFVGYSNLNAGRASYYMLRDNTGNPVQWYNTKSQFEIDRLNALGLMDETYKPLDEISRQYLESKSKYLNINIGGTFNLFKGLSLELRYQTERTENYSKQFYDKTAYVVKTQINDATLIQSDGKRINYIPTGGQVNETRSDVNSSTLRAQLNYNSAFQSKHEVQAIAGAERRKIVGSGTNVYKYGYDDFSLNYKPVDELMLRQYIIGTQSINNQFMLSRAENGFSYTDDRFVSFYGNGSYTFDRKITATASIRMDQSNLFGTDPKYQYKPLWSAGLLYVISERKISWLDRLAVRATYGINGNIAKKSGPYLIVQDLAATNYYTNEAQSQVSSPPNSGLRWEKTKVTNLAIDFRVLENRLSGSIEFYNKSTADLLGDLTSDPTLGWSSIMVNYGSMFNRGIDVSLNSENIRTKELRWNTTLNFNYNKNELTRLSNTANTVTNYIGGAQNRVGKPMDAMYSVRYAGLNATGRPKALTADGKEVTTTQSLKVEDLVYNGTATPPYSVSLLNNFSYKGFELFFMFIYYGGHVMRDVAPLYLTKVPELNYTTNMDRNSLNYWKKAGDELNPDVAPAYYEGASGAITNIWEAADRSMQKADYIKLRDVTLSYNLPGKLLQKYAIKGVRLSMQVQNAWRWSANNQHLDPEVWNGTTLNAASRGSLIPPTYTVGLNVNF